MAERSSETRPPEFEPPAACVQRVIKGVLPENAQITKEAKAAFGRAAGIFIFYLTHCANDFARDVKHQTIQLQDIKNALRELEFDEFLEPLEAFVEEYKRESENKKKSRPSTSNTSSVAAATASHSTAADAKAATEADEEDDEEET